MDDERRRGLIWLLVIATVVELVVLRTATRTLIHIPGTDQFEAPIGVVAEVGRLAYYVAVISLIAVLVALAVNGLRSRRPLRIACGAAILTFSVVGAAGRIGAVSWIVVGWFGMATLVLVGVLGWRGVRSLPIGMFLVSSVAAGSSVLAQFGESGLTGIQVDMLVWLSEAALVLAALSAPLLLERPPGWTGVLVGAVSAIAVAGSLAAQSSTISIVVLWNVGVPGWMPGLAYALATGALAATVWTSVSRGEWAVLVGSVLLAAGGVGMISTYQTGLAIVGVVVLGERDASLPGGDVVPAEARGDSPVAVAVS